MKLSIYKKILNFKIPAGTSRGFLSFKTSYILSIDNGERIGLGECSYIEGLSRDPILDYEKKLNWLKKNINRQADSLYQSLEDFPSIKFGLETAFLSLNSMENLILFPSNFTNKKDSIKINGLIWMGSQEYILSQIKEKINAGFSCIKMKIGINFEEEYKILKFIRFFFPENIEIRVDANGAFGYKEIREILFKLKELNIHSVEQPIKPKQINKIAELCNENIIPIALDEELIQKRTLEEKKNLLNIIKPHYIILKPSLLGGFKECEEWINICENLNIKWWITSALEGNIGLNAISQWTYTLNNTIPQGLGTGGLYVNNNYPFLEITKGGYLNVTF